MKKILVIDDDPDILEAIQVVLESGGYNSLTTAKGAEVYDHVKNYKPDLIILDVLLSGNDGRIICKRLKTDKSTKNIPVIMISAHPTAKESSVDCGADSFVAKPFSISELLSKVGKLTK
jgi:DNA-binding response OmpR family regulator